MPFVNRLRLDVIGPRRWRLVEPLTYRGRDETWRVPPNFGTDLASVPRCMRWLVDSYGAWTLAAVLHDWLCALAAGRVTLGPTATGAPYPRPSRRDADGVFRRVLREEGVPRALRCTMWAAVRLGGRLDGGLSWRDTRLLLLVLLCTAWWGVIWLVQRSADLVDRIIP